MNVESDTTIDFAKSRLAWSETLQVGELKISASQILELLGPHLTEERKERLSKVVSKRSKRVVSVLENIYDRGNVSAVMRSSEAFGFVGMNVVDAPDAKFKAANRVTKGAEKWLDVRSYSSPKQVVAQLKSEGYQLWATDLETQDTIEQIDWSKPTAIVLGNEHSGVSKEMLKSVDGRFRVPMVGFSQSFNISVAAALIFYRAYMELSKAGPDAYLSENEQRQVLANYYLRCFDNPEALLKHKI